jgi:hypothetical protein
MAMQLRPLSIGELLDRTFSIYRNNFGLFVGISAIPPAVMLVTIIGIVAVIGAAAFARPGAITGIAGMLVLLPVFVLAYVAAWGLSQGAAVYAVSQFYADRTTTIRDSYRFVWRRVWPLVGLVIVVSFILVASFIVGLLAIIIGSIVAMVLAGCYCSLAVPVMVLEGQGVMDSLNRSYRLVKTDLGKVFLVLLVSVVIQYAAVYLAMIPAFAGIIALGPQNPAQVWISLSSNVVQLVAGAIAAPIMPIGLGLAYYDIRVRQEALDLQMMMAALGPVPAAPSGTPSAPSGSAASAGAGPS